LIDKSIIKGTVGKNGIVRMIKKNSDYLVTQLKGQDLVLSTKNLRSEKFSENFNNEKACCCSSKKNRLAAAKYK
jgi:hypothetical protein